MAETDLRVRIIPDTSLLDKELNKPRKLGLEKKAKDSDTGEKEGKGLNSALGKLTGAVALGNIAATGVSLLLEGLSNLLAPLVNILKALFIVVLLPIMPLITELTKAIGGLIKSTTKTKDARKKLRDEMTFGVLEIKEADSTIARILKSAGGGLVDLLILLVDVVKGVLGLWFDFWRGVGSKLITPVLQAVVNMFKLIWIDILKPAFEFLGTLIPLAWTNIVKPAFEFLNNIGETIWNEILKPAFKFLDNVGEMIWGILKNAFNSLVNSITNLIRKIPFIGGGSKSGDRATGGLVSSGQSFLVGERGPEIFTPNASGKISTSSGGGDITVQINNTSVRNDQDITKIVRQVSMALQRQTTRRFSNG